MSVIESEKEKNFYELLGVQRSATKEEIRDAYRELAKIFHPDSHYYDEILESAGITPTESGTFKLITDAYNTLSNDERRAEYDRFTVGDLPTWETSPQEEWHAEFRVESSPALNEKRSEQRAYRQFGAATKRRSAFDEEELNGIRPVSEMIRRNRGVWSRLCNLLGL